MPSTQLTGSEKRSLVLWVVAGILGILVAQHYFFQAFPEASVDFKVARPQALERAKTFVSSLGEKVDGYRTAIEFTVDEKQKVYLERQLGLKQANELAGVKVNLWYWSVRFYRPQQEEEFLVAVSPSGQVVGYKHVLPEAQAGATIERAAAQQIAQTFLTAKLGKAAGDWKFLEEEANSEKKPNRVDWSFTWENPALKIKEAPYREKILIAGDKPAGAAEKLRVPETWERDFDRLRSGNDTLALIFTVPYIAVLGIAVWLAIVLTRQQRTRWALAIKLGAIVVAFMFLQGLNDWPLWGSDYDTKSAYSGFLLLQVLKALGMAVISALTISLVLPAAEPLYRQSQPGNLRFSKLLTRRGLRSKEFFSAAVIGLCLAAAHIGFVVLFYTVATKFGAWAPQEVNYSDAVNTGFPWISGVAIGLLASMNEEFTFRLFAIPFFTRFTKSRWIAVIVPAFLWGFLHSNYPQEPAYIRGLEVGLIGIVAGIVMLRWGILATLIWHYTVDASLVGLFLVRSDNWYFRISGVVVGLAAAAPLLFAAASYLRRGTFEAVEDLQNSAEPLPELSFSGTDEPVPQATASRYQPLSGAAIGVLAVCTLLGAVAAVKLKQERLGDYLRLNKTIAEAKQLSDSALRKQGVDLATLHNATVFLDNSDGAATEFLREKLGAAGVNKIYEEQIPVGLWGTRYFKENDPEEYFVVLKPDGELHSIHHTVAEKKEGASLSKEEAAAIAEKYLAAEKKIDLNGWSLVDSKSEKRPNRTDHTLTWEQKTPLDGEKFGGEHAYRRIDMSVIGIEPSDYRTYVKIPDEWRRQREEQGLGRTLFFVGRLIALIGLGAVMCVIYFRNFRSEDARAIPWKRISGWTVWLLAGYVLTIVFGDRMGQVLQQYQTAIPLKVMYVVTAIGLVLGGAFYAGVVVLLFGLAWFYGRRAVGEEQMPRWVGMPGVYYRDAVLIGIGGMCALLGLQSAFGWLSARSHVAHRFASMAFEPDFSAHWPAGAVFGGAAMRALFFTAMICAVAAFFTAYVKPLALKAVILLVGAATLVGDWGSVADFSQKYAYYVVLLAVIGIGLAVIARTNLLGIFLVIFSGGLLGPAVALLSQPNPSLRTSAYTLLATVAIVWILPLVKWKTAAAQS